MRVEISPVSMVYQWVMQGTNGSIDNARRPGRGSMIGSTINEESDCLRENICSAPLGRNLSGKIPGKPALRRLFRAKRELFN
jgi:hypothetical protein